MSALTKTILAASIALAFGTAAYASDATDTLSRAGQGYVVDTNGQPSVVDLNTPVAAMMARADDEQRHYTNDSNLSATTDRSRNDVFSR